MSGDKSQAKFDTSRLTNEVMGTYGPAPYIRTDPPETPFRKYKRWIAYGTLVPIRIILILLTIVFFLPGAYVFSNGHHSGNPIPTWKRPFLAFFVASIGRLWLWSFGVLWINVEGREHWKKGAERTPFLIGNHVSWADITVYLYMFGTPAFVAKEETLKIPIIGPFSKYLGSYFVARSLKGKAASDATRQALIGHAASWDGTGSQITVWPEGTTSNGKCLLQFKTGVFGAAAPVQPVLLKYGGPNHSMAWESVGGAPHFFTTLSQIYNTVTVKFLPVITPTEAEKTDAHAFAKRVREIMAKAGNLDRVENFSSLREKFLWHDHCRYGKTTRMEYETERDALRQELHDGAVPYMLSPDGKTKKPLHG